jgi:FtsH-binding integral membrane protein
MSAIKFVISAVLAVVFLYFIITGIQNLIQSNKEVEEAESMIRAGIVATVIF